MTNAIWQTAAQTIAEALINSLPAGIAIAAIAGVLLRLRGKSTSASRFTTWFAVLVLVVVLPFVHAFAGRTINAANFGFALPNSWAYTFLALWLLIAGVTLGRTLFGMWKLRTFRANCSPIDLSEFDADTQETVAGFQKIRPVMICTSSAVQVPTAVGFFHPTIVLPEWAMCDLSSEELKAVLLHEFAHLDRRDDWTNLAQKLIGSVFFFHPAVWWIERRLSLEREMACDERVITETRDRSAYAQFLVSLAEKSAVRRAVAMAHALVGHAGQTSRRLAEILSGDRLAKRRALVPTGFALLLLAGSSVVIVDKMPELVAFQPSASSVASATLPVHPMPSAFVVPVSKNGNATSNIGATNIVKPARKHKSVSSPDVLVAKHTRSPKAASPLFVEAGLQDAVATPVMQVVMQTTEYQSNGLIRWTICVWQVSYEKPTKHRALDPRSLEIQPKSI